MDHVDHEPGTMDECAECRALAVEPGWYKVMREERLMRAPFEVLVPEADEPDVDVLIEEIPARPDVEVLDLGSREHEPPSRRSGR